jgi:flagellin
LQALSVFRNKASLLSEQRGMIGALQNRTVSSLSSLGNTTVNIANAEQRIRDVDIAETSSDYVRTQILQQTAAAVLAQANIQPRPALDLLSRV